MAMGCSHLLMAAKRGPNCHRIFCTKKIQVTGLSLGLYAMCYAPILTSPKPGPTLHPGELWVSWSLFLLISELLEIQTPPLLLKSCPFFFSKQQTPPPWKMQILCSVLDFHSRLFSISTHYCSPARQDKRLPFENQKAGYHSELLLIAYLYKSSLYLQSTKNQNWQQVPYAKKQLKGGVQRPVGSARYFS